MSSADMQALESFCEVINRSDDLEGMSAVLDGQLRDHGFPRFAYRGVNFGGIGPAPVACWNYPEEWQVHYVQSCYSTVDPVIIAARTSLLPFRWGQTENVRPTTPKQRTFFLEAHDFGLTSGLCVPVHGVGGEFAVLALAADMNDRELSSLTVDQIGRLQVLALYFHNAVRKKVDDDEKPALVHLTPRERECLTWTAKGKTSWEVSMVLGISEGTVVFHLKNAMKKYGVFNKYHAVVKAIMQHVIEP